MHVIRRSEKRFEKIRRIDLPRTDMMNGVPSTSKSTLSSEVSFDVSTFTSLDDNDVPDCLLVVSKQYNNAILQAVKNLKQLHITSSEHF